MVFSFFLYVIQIASGSVRALNKVEQNANNYRAWKYNKSTAEKRQIVKAIVYVSFFFYIFNFCVYYIITRQIRNLNKSKIQPRNKKKYEITKHKHRLVEAIVFIFVYSFLVFIVLPRGMIWRLIESKPTPKIVLKKKNHDSRTHTPISLHIWTPSSFPVFNH